jgi:3-deoxy-D-manno-octulosonic-acid transferase
LVSRPFDEEMSMPGLLPEDFTEEERQYLMDQLESLALTYGITAVAVRVSMMVQQGGHKELAALMAIDLMPDQVQRDDALNDFTDAMECIDELKAAIINAPHDPRCETFLTGGACNCWKSE